MYIFEPFLRLFLLLLGAISLQHNTLGVVALVTSALLGHKMLSPASLARAYVFVAQRATVGLGSRLLWEASESGSVGSVNVNGDAFTATLALTMVFFFNTFFHKMGVKRRNLNDLTTCVTVGEH